MGLVDLALVAAFGQRGVRHRGRRTRGDHEHGIRLEADQLDDLAGDRGVGAGEAFDRAEGHAILGRKRFHGLDPDLAVGIGVVAEEGDRLVALGLGMLEQRLGHQADRLRHGEGPLELLAVEAVGRQRYQRRLGVGRRAGGGHHAGCRGAGHQHIDLGLGKELGDVLGGVGRVGGVIEHDPVDFLAGDAGREQLRRVLLRAAQHGRRAGGGNADADVDVGQRGRGAEQGQGDHQRLDGQFGLSCFLLVL
jgi:hypothetical protein